MYGHDLDLLNMDVAISEVFSGINDVHANSNSGINGIPPIFLKSCNYIMSRVLWLIYNKSLNSGIFPDLWNTLLLLYLRVEIKL